jgi:hypothetical protein
VSYALSDLPEMKESVVLPEFSQAQVMLSLALLSYRGFWNPDRENREKMAEMLRTGLAELEPLGGDWKLVWGPGTYRYLGSVFDASMMYVAQHRQQNSRFAIAVRGTNPVSLFDWLLGDFLPHRQIPWQAIDGCTDCGARISLSTALGVKILLGMRAEIDPALLTEAGKFAFLCDDGPGSEPATPAPDTAKQRAAVRPAEVLPDRLSARHFSRLLARYQSLWGLAEKLVGEMGSSVVEVLLSRNAPRTISLRRRLVRALDRSLELAPELPVAMLMPGRDELSVKDEPGVGLLELLGNLAQTYGDSLELYVTGHSKGGALAPALALFLSDTQRNEEIPVRRRYQWNPRARADIYCYAFAAPTPGNADFARYFNGQLGKRFYRYANTLDLVTRAWESERLRTIGDIFGDSVNYVKGIDMLFVEIADEIEHLDYTHLGEDYLDPDHPGRRVEKHVVEFAGQLEESISSFMLQELHQHVQAYVDMLGLDKVFDVHEMMGAGANRRH